MTALTAWNVEYGQFSGVGSCCATEEEAIVKAVTQALFLISTGAEIRYIELTCSVCDGDGSFEERSGKTRRSKMTRKVCPQCKGKDNRRRLEISDYFLRETLNFIERNFSQQTAKG